MEIVNDGNTTYQGIGFGLVSNAIAECCKLRSVAFNVFKITGTIGATLWGGKATAGASNDETAGQAVQRTAKPFLD
jgi:hypothetical protein